MFHEDDEFDEVAFDREFEADDDDDDDAHGEDEEDSGVPPLHEEVARPAPPDLSHLELERYEPDDDDDDDDDFGGSGRFLV